MGRKEQGEVGNCVFFVNKNESRFSYEILVCADL
jgi:hypothetical protein